MLFVCNLILFLACFGSFAWSMGKFFRAPAGVTVGMRAVAALGLAFALWHLVSLLRSGAVSPLMSGIGILLYLSALALFWWALSANRRQPLSAVYSPDQPVHLVTDGPYRLVRHPFYASYLLTWLAGIPASGNYWLTVTFAVMLGLYLHAAGVEEEKFSTSSLAGEYRRYRSTTGQLFPNPFKLLRPR